MSISKERLKWTQELHDLFEKSVNQLGGPERVTPKSVLRVMGIPGLTIYHVKSHLQKYRMSKFVPESSNKGKFERRSISEILPNFSTTSGAQLQEALILQMQVQMRLSDQVEVQKSLKDKIEAQGRFLERIMEKNKNQLPIAKPNKLISPISLPSLSDEFDSNVNDPKSDFDKSEIVYNEEQLQAPKRLKVDDDFFVRRFKSEPYYQGTKTSFPVEETNMPWGFGFCEAPLTSASYDSYG